MSLLLRCFALRLLVGICGLVVIVWIAASFFHGFAAYVVIFLLFHCLDRTCRVLFKYPVFNQHQTVQTLNLVKAC